MTVYIVSFEINDLERRKRFKAAMREYGQCCPINEYTWAVNVEKTAAQIRDELLKIVNSADRLFIIRSGTEAAWSNLYGDKNTEWLKKWL
jgi:hypothetical protein